VTLKFAELFVENEDDRLFDIAIEGELSESRVDIYETTGGMYIAYDIDVTREVTDGTLNVDLQNRLENPKLGAMLVERVGPSD